MSPCCRRLSLACVLILAACGLDLQISSGGGQARCGDGAIDPDEVCDGRALDGETCASQGFDAGVLTCQRDCSGYDTRACYDLPECPNHVVEGDEACDGVDLDGETCESQGFAGGVLACAADCDGFDTSLCLAFPRCGNGLLEPGEECDGADLGGQSCASQGQGVGTLTCGADCSGFVTAGCCRPVCDGRVCGPDPVCGASCGSCAEGNQCDAEGACVPLPVVCVDGAACGATACCPTGHCSGDVCLLPDLSVDPDDVASSVSFTVSEFAEDACEIQEQCIVASGPRRLLEFTTTTPNLGAVDLVIGDPRDNPDLVEYSPCHDHYHVHGYAQYRLLRPNGSVAAYGHKQAFCLMDTSPVREDAGAGQYNCSFQGITAGWSDTYGGGLPCQWIDVTDVPEGDYLIEVHVNFERQFTESDYNNNVIRVPVHVPDPACAGEPEICGDGIDQDCSGTDLQCPPGCEDACAGRVCGVDPTCGESCGGCAQGSACDGAGQCVTGAHPACADYLAANDGCDCGCGILDADCAGGGCAEPNCRDAACGYCYNADGASTGCGPLVPPGWTCSAAFYGTSDGCDCGCGLIDPDCTTGGCAVGCADAACDYCYGGTPEVCTP